MSANPTKLKLTERLAALTPEQMADALYSAISLDSPDFQAKFRNAFEKGHADKNYKSDNVDPPIFAAVQFHNRAALKQLLAMGVDLNMLNTNKVSILNTAFACGDEETCRDLMNAGAKMQFCGKNLLSTTLEFISEYALLEYGWINTEDPRKAGNNPALVAELRDFFFQRGAYARTKAKDPAKPFAKQGPFHAYYWGKPELLSMLLSTEQISPSMPATGTNRSAKNLVRNPSEYTDAFQPFGRLQYIDYETDKDGNQILNFKFKFNNKSQTATPIEFFVHYNFGPAKATIEQYIKDHPGETHLEKLAQQMDAKLAEEKREQEERVTKHLDSVRTDFKHAEHAVSLAVAQSQTAVNTAKQAQNLAIETKRQAELTSEHALNAQFVAQNTVHETRMALLTQAHAQAQLVTQQQETMRTAQETKQLAEYTYGALQNKVDINAASNVLLARNKAYPCVTLYHSKIIEELRAQMTGIFALASNEVNRKKNKLADYVGGGIEQAGNIIHIPVLSKLVEWFGKGIQAKSESREQGRNEKGNSSTTTALDLDDFYKIMATKLVSAFETILQTTNKVNEIEKLAKLAVEELKKALKSGSFVKSQVNGYQDVCQQLAEVVTTNEAYKKKMQTLQVSTTPMYEAGNNATATFTHPGVAMPRPRLAPC